MGRGKRQVKDPGGSHNESIGRIAVGEIDSVM